MPAGENYGRGWCLLLRGDLDQIDIESLHSFSFDDNDDGQVVFEGLVFIRADAVTPGIGDDPNVVMICELADVRYLLHNQFYSYPLDMQFNVRVPSGGDIVYYPHSTDSDDNPFTWQTMLDAVWEEFNEEIIDPDSEEPLFGDSPELPFEADGTPEKFCFLNISLWLAYNSILKRLASRICPEPTFTNWTITAINDQNDESYDAFIEAFNANKAWRIDDTQSVQSLIGRMPSSFDVVFHKMDTHHGAEPVASITNDNTFPQWSSTPYYAVNVDADEDVDPGTGTKGILWDDLSAVNNSFEASTVGEEDIDNLDDLENRATERVFDYTTAIGTVPTFSLQYSGIFSDVGFLPGTSVSGYGVMNIGNGFVTSVIHASAPLSVSASGTWEEDWESINQNLSPPDLAKATTPDYPEVVQWCRPDSVSQTSTKIYSASVGLLDPRPATAGQFIKIGDCWLFNNSSGSLTLNVPIEARMIGQVKAVDHNSQTLNMTFYSTDGSGGGAGGVPDTETFVLGGTRCDNGQLITIEKTLTVLTN